MKTIASLLLCFFSLSAYAGELTLRFGPAGLGNGGTNPLGIPPGPTDFDLTWLTASDWETSVSVSPGIFVGKRAWHESGLYLGVGGGIVISGNGVGVGPYAGIGGSPGEGPFRFNIELKQALGMTSIGLISPYAFRLGVSYDFD